MSTRLNLEFLRTRAKALLKAARAGDGEAIGRIHRAHPVLGRANPESIPNVVALHDAQLIIGREHGFSSWAQLKTYVEALARCELSGVEQLQAAIRAGDMDAALDLITAQPDLSASRTEPLGWTPLHVAASVGNLDCVRLLLDAGAGIDPRDTNNEATPLRVAIGFGQSASARLLLERGADATARDAKGATMQQTAAYGKHVDVIRMLEHVGVTSDIFATVALEDATVTRELVAHNPDAVRERLPSYGMTPLHLAAFHDSTPMIELLLELGADMTATDECKRSAIDLALHSGKAGAYQRLEAHGAVADAKLLALVETPKRAEQMARLHTALVDADVEAVAHSLDADPTLLNARLPDVWGSGGTFGATPLHWAAFLGHVELARFLIGRGADMTLRDLTYHSTPLDWACESRRSSEMIAFLRAHGAS